MTLCQETRQIMPVMEWVFTHSMIWESLPVREIQTSTNQMGLRNLLQNASEETQQSTKIHHYVVLQRTL
jgi:hypothetical protein